MVFVSPLLFLSGKYVAIVLLKSYGQKKKRSG